MVFVCVYGSLSNVNPRWQSKSNISLSILLSTDPDHKKPGLVTFGISSCDEMNVESHLDLAPVNVPFTL